MLVDLNDIDDHSINIFVSESRYMSSSSIYYSMVKTIMLRWVVWRWTYYQPTILRAGILRCVNIHISQSVIQMKK
jgi:hypothetical protein